MKAYIEMFIETLTNMWSSAQFISGPAVTLLTFTSKSSSMPIAQQ